MKPSDQTRVAPVCVRSPGSAAGSANPVPPGSWEAGPEKGRFTRAGRKTIRKRRALDFPVTVTRFDLQYGQPESQIVQVHANPVVLYGVDVYGARTEPLPDANRTTKQRRSASCRLAIVRFPRPILGRSCHNERSRHAWNLVLCDRPFATLVLSRILPWVSQQPCSHVQPHQEQGGTYICYK